MKDEKNICGNRDNCANEMSRNTIYRFLIKRALDIVLSSLALIALSPLFIVVSILILIEDYGPIFFKQRRVGKDEQIFDVFKFRTMCVGAEKFQTVGVEVIGRDPRITRIGYILRRLKIDELPQLLNILKGDMSIIGPRPSLPDYLQIYEPWERERFAVRPGLSGLAQINGNIYLTQREKSEYDIEYIKKLSFILDFKIVTKTFFVVVFGEEKFKK